MDINKIKLLAIDCDGVLTDGNFYVSSDGTVTKSFNTRDFSAIKRLQSLGVEVIIITGSNDGAVDMKAESLGITCISSAKNKVKEIEFIINEIFDWSEVGFIGDAENDIELIKKVGFSACPNDAIPEILSEVKYISNNNGGSNAVRDIIKWMIEKMGHEWISESHNW